MNASDEINPFKSLFTHEVIFTALDEYRKTKPKHLPEFIDILLDCTEKPALLDKPEIQLGILQEVVSVSSSLEDIQDEAYRNLILHLMQVDSIKRIIELVRLAESVKYKYHSRERTDYLLCMIVQLWDYQLLNNDTFEFITDHVQINIPDNTAWAAHLSKKLIADAMRKPRIETNQINNIGVFPLHSNNLLEDHTAVKMKLIDLLWKSNLLTKEITQLILDSTFYPSVKHANNLIGILEILSDAKNPLINQERLDKILRINPEFWILYKKVFYQFKECNILYEFYNLYTDQIYVDLLLSLNSRDCAKLSFCIPLLNERGMLDAETLEYIINFNSDSDPHCTALVKCMIALEEIGYRNFLSKSPQPDQFAIAVSLLEANKLASEENIQILINHSPHYYADLLSILNSNKLLNRNNFNRIFGHRDTGLVAAMLLSYEIISQDLLDKIIKNPEQSTKEYLNINEKKSPPLQNISPPSNNLNSPIKNPDNVQNNIEDNKNKPPVDSNLPQDNRQPRNDNINVQNPPQDGYAELRRVLYQNNLPVDPNLEKVFNHRDPDLLAASIVESASKHPMSQELFDHLIQHPDGAQLFISRDELTKLNNQYIADKNVNDEYMRNNWPTLFNTFKWRNSLGWQWDAGKLRQTAWEKLVEELNKLDSDNQKSNLIDYALSLRLFNEHRSNYLYREGSDTATVEKIKKELKVVVEKHQQHPNEPIEKDDKHHIYQRKKMN